MVESKKLGYLAGPAIFSFVSKYSLGAFTQIFAGHVGTIDLAAVSVENSLIAGFSYGIMLGMGSALETLCGQAVGAGKLDMLGVYMQRSWVLLLSMAFVLWPMYIFAGQVLKFIGQDTQISEAAGTFAIWMIPQLFAYALNFPVAKFLQAQVLSWLLMVKLELGLVGAAVVLNGSWWWLSWFMCLVGGVGLRGTASRGKRFGISVDSFASLLLLLLCSAWKHVLYGSDFVCWIPQECTSLCRRLLYLHEYIRLDHHGIFWDERRHKELPLVRDGRLLLPM
ncbi:protein DETOXIFICATION 29-like [Glycine soja]|uniref:protein DETOXIFICATION 29-like n=1 Tax=Glycine soja TaxID=3848 RepID=UPI0010400C0F|nr:protein DETOXIFICATION 29-like [Glycine soja]XP_028195527.1 protein DETOXIFICATION 29-like [Glycine soja]XP_028195528.1 protein DETOXIFICATION 29-like [Glycine soja]XP_028195529.1 protein DETOXIFICATION 29-like [Glycine soja]XP_028195530.1 protein DETOXIFICATION 29-like [Glycine soja]XP_028195531.1 protein DETOXIFICATION 29-like [Glycine soja]XP_028195532.1 protein DETOXIFICATION 29-like [Glycine soja]XP_028195538.1 protein DETOXIFICATION 29-like [Glycine soja]XP_028195546.1 protein DETO